MRFQLLTFCCWLQVKFYMVAEVHSFVAVGSGDRCVFTVGPVEGPFVEIVEPFPISEHEFRYIY